MSQIIHRTGWKELSHVVYCRGKTYLVDSSQHVHSYRTYVNPFNDRTDRIIGKEVYMEKHADRESMIVGHMRICERLEKYIAR